MRKWLLWLFGIGLIVILMFLLREVFLGNWILPQTFSFGPIAIYYYGLIMAAAVAAGFYLAMKRVKAYGLDDSAAENILFWVSIGGFLGARLYHVISSYPYYITHPTDVLKVWNGGLSIYGALLGGLITLLIFRKALVSRVTLDILDWLTPSLIVGQIIGRFGNLFNYEAFGYPTNLPWKMFVPLQFRPYNYRMNNFFHPFFLYEILGNCIILFIILRLENRDKKHLFLYYLLLYNTLRFGLEFLRIDSTFIGAVRLNAVMSLLLAAVAASYLLYRSKHAQIP